VSSISQDFRFDNGNQTIFLTYRSISCQSPSVFLNSLLTWKSITDFQDGTPFGESASIGIVLSCHLCQGIQTHSCSLILSARENLKTLINLNSWYNALVSEHVNEFHSVAIELIDLFRVKDDSTNILLNSWGTK